MESYVYLKDLAIIIVFAKTLGILARKIKAPQVVGEIIAGLIIGPGVLGLVTGSPFLSQMAEIGVILLMFCAGLETDLNELIRTGPIAFLVACMGVLIPLVSGTLLYSAFYGFSGFGTEKFYRGLFIGVILTATSVSITVQTLRELGHLKGRLGTLILSSAIIDDIIGIIVLTIVVGFKSENAKPSRVLINTLLFFIFAAVVGVIAYYFFKKIDEKYKHRRRIPILGLALCMIMAFLAEHWFGIADITGAYVAGIILCNLKDSNYIVQKMDISSYMLFGPIFFASIGLKTEFDGFTTSLLLFSICFVLVGLISKIIGCGLTARIFKFSGKDSFKIGVGMMTRGEVALIVARKGLDVGLLDGKFFTSVILLIMVSSIVTPILLKALYKGEKNPQKVPQQVNTSA